MYLIKWAEKEIELACEKERRVAEQHGDPDGAGYGVLCYQSALKAFKSLMDDRHSGFSIGLTMGILNRLVDTKPLTPIFDTEDVWKFCWMSNDGSSATYQCTRMSSLFKKVFADGRVEYSDNDRVTAYDVDDERNVPYHNGLVSRIIDEMFPITMPYGGGPNYKVYCCTLLTDEKNGDFDTRAVLYAINSDTNERIEINRYFKESDHRWVEIGVDEYFERYVMDQRRRGLDVDKADPCEVE